MTSPPPKKTQDLFSDDDFSKSQHNRNIIVLAIYLGILLVLIIVGYSILKRPFPSEKSSEAGIVQYILSSIFEPFSESKEDPNTPWYARKPDADTLAKAEQGDSEAQFVVGRYYMHQNQWDKAVAWFEKAATQGHWKALNNAGTAYVEGKRGVPQNRAKACDYFERAYAIAKQAALAENIAICYDHRTEGDLSKAVTYYQIAAQQGMPVSQRNLGHMYTYGDGVAPNPELSAYWLRQAAMQEDALAAYMLGIQYWDNKGVAPHPRNQWVGYVLIKRAKSNIQESDKSEFLRIQFTERVVNRIEQSDDGLQYHQAWIQLNWQNQSIRNVLQELDKQVPYTPPTLPTAPKS